MQSSMNVPTHVQRLIEDQASSKDVMSSRLIIKRTERIFVFADFAVIVIWLTVGLLTALMVGFIIILIIFFADGEDVVRLHSLGFECTHEISIVDR